MVPRQCSSPQVGVHACINSTSTFPLQSADLQVWSGLGRLINNLQECSLSYTQAQQHPKGQGRHTELKRTSCTAKRGPRSHDALHHCPALIQASFVRAFLCAFQPCLVASLQVGHCQWPAMSCSSLGTRSGSTRRRAWPSATAPPCASSRSLRRCPCWLPLPSARKQALASSSSPSTSGMRCVSL